MKKSDADFAEDKEAIRERWLRTGQTLTDALPYILRYDDKAIVIKYGGHAMGDTELGKRFAQDIVLLKQIGIHPIIVHGGGPQIGAMLERLKIKSEFIGGLRVTDEATVEIVEMVLAGSINKQIVTAINQAGGRAIGLSGKDGSLMIAKKAHKTSRDPQSSIEKVLDLGFVGEPEEVSPAILDRIIGSDLIPVIAPIGLGRGGETYNVNADTAAGAIAGAIQAERLLLLTDVAGVLDSEKALIPQISLDGIQALIDDGTVSGGMIPKVETAMDAVRRGVKGAVIMDGRIPHVLLLELFTKSGTGTLVVPGGSEGDART